jgi:hypothetical protein
LRKAQARRSRSAGVNFSHLVVLNGDSASLPERTGEIFARFIKALFNEAESQSKQDSTSSLQAISEAPAGEPAMRKLSLLQNFKERENRRAGVIRGPDARELDLRCDLDQQPRPRQSQLCKHCAVSVLRKRIPASSKRRKVHPVALRVKEIALMRDIVVPRNTGIPACAPSGVALREMSGKKHARTNYMDSAGFNPAGRTGRRPMFPPLPVNEFPKARIVANRSSFSPILQIVNRDALVHAVPLPPLFQKSLD